MGTYVKTWLGVTIIVVIALTAGMFIWYQQKNLPEVAQPEQISISKKTDKIADLAPSGVEGWQTYRNEKYEFEIEYPIGWFVYDNNPSDVFIQPTKEITGSIPNHFNAFEIKVTTTNEMDLSKIIKDIGKNSGITYEQENAKIADMIFGIKAISKCEGVGCGSPEWFVIRNGVVYHFTTNLGYASNQKNFDIILSTFKFID